MNKARIPKKILSMQLKGKFQGRRAIYQASWFSGNEVNLFTLFLLVPCYVQPFKFSSEVLFHDRILKL
jgi:hypothetical protein